MVYESIKNICDKKNISVTSLEKKIGLGNGTIQKWKYVSPNVTTLKKVADELGITVGYIMDR